MRGSLGSYGNLGFDVVGGCAGASSVAVPMGPPLDELLALVDCGGIDGGDVPSA